MSNLDDRRLSPYYHGDIDLSKIIGTILSRREVYLREANKEENGKASANFDEHVEKFENHFIEIMRKEQKNGFVDQCDKNKLVSDLLEMMRDRIDTYEKDLNIAENIQKKLIPLKVPEVIGYELAAYYHPSERVGGDYYDFYLLEKERFYFVIADVSGHGVPSSLIVSSMQAFLSAQVMEHKSLHSMIENLNKYLVKTLIPGKFATLFIGYFELNDGAFHYINAGHNPPYILKKDGSVEMLTKGGPLLGMFGDASYVSGYANFSQGDMLIAFTDGVIEAMNPQEEEFSEERFLDIIATEQDKPLHGIMIQIFKALRLFCEGNAYGDDVTLLLMRKKEKKASTDK